MSWLDNGVVRLGIDLNLGGAITHLSKSGEAPNIINSWDWGRQVQMSFYSGPIPFFFGEKRPAPQWAGLGWNPIQAGDHFGNRAQVLAQTNDGKKLYVKCRPMQWPMDNVPGDCTFESWLQLRGSTVSVRGRLSNTRADRSMYTARAQELPAVYTNGAYHRIFTYGGPHPFQNEPLRQVESKGPPEWSAWLSTENWSALVDDSGWGLGVWNPGTVRFAGGFAGVSGTGGPKDDPCGYLAPNSVEILDHDIVYDFRYELTLGTLEEIRAEVYRHGTAPNLARWEFRANRQGWHYQNAADGGWPIQGELAVRWEKADPQIVSPWFFAQKARSVVIEAAASQGLHGQLFWATVAEPGFSETRSLRWAMQGDGAMRECRVPLPNVEALVQLRIDPENGGAGELKLRSVRVE